MQFKYTFETKQERINSIASSDIPSWQNQLLVCIFLLDIPYFYYLEYNYEEWYVYDNKLSI